MERIMLHPYCFSKSVNFHIRKLFSVIYTIQIHVQKQIVILSNKIFSRDVFFFQLPYLPEFVFRAYDMVRVKHLLRGRTPKSLSPITKEDINAYKYTFGKSGKI